jgi:hypothetical protein
VLSLLEKLLGLVTEFVKTLHGSVKPAVHYYVHKGNVPVLLLTEHHAMMAYWGSEGIAPRIP